MLSEELTLLLENNPLVHNNQLSVTNHAALADGKSDLYGYGTHSLSSVSRTPQSNFQSLVNPSI